MKENTKTRVLRDCLKKNRAAILLFAVMTLGNAGVFLLYDLDTEPFFYTELLLLVFLLLLLSVDFFRELHSAAQRERCLHTLLTGSPELPEPRNAAEADFTEMLCRLSEENARREAAREAERQEAEDYYTTWVHQIKTPIAVMKLRLNEENEQNRALKAELFRIEQYVELVLSYIRLGSSSNDLVVQEYDVDEIIRETLRKYAPQFILRKLHLSYAPGEMRAVTDRKWLALILEQLLSNALKYTAQGEIRIETAQNRIRISDTGIGIAPEDLPRIFEKGYTGVNGRLERQSSGLGLFLCKKAARLIGAEITCESEPGKGTSFTVLLPQREA